MDDKKSILTTLPPLLVAVGTLITAVIGLGNFMSAPAPSITEFDVSPSIIDAGGNATLKWAVSGDASSVSIEPSIGTVALSGSRQISPANTTNYTMTANNKGQVKKASAQLIVRKVMPSQGSVQESNNSSNSSMQEPIPISVPSSDANKVGDEPVHNEVPVSINTVNSASSTNNVKSASNAIKDSNANSAGNANSINTTTPISTTEKDKSAMASASKPSGSYGIASKDTGDEFIQASNIESASKSKEPNGSTNESTISATGDEPIQMMSSKSTKDASINPSKTSVNLSINPSTSPTGQTKAAAGTAKTKSNVGDFA